MINDFFLNDDNSLHKVIVSWKYRSLLYVVFRLIFRGRLLHIIPFYLYMYVNLIVLMWWMCICNNVDLIDFLVFNATFSNISAISWRPVLVVEESVVPGENHRPWASNWYTLSLATASRVHLFVLYKAGREPTPYWW